MKAQWWNRAQEEKYIKPKTYRVGNMCVDEQPVVVNWDVPIYPVEQKPVDPPVTERVKISREERIEKDYKAARELLTSERSGYSNASFYLGTHSHVVISATERACHYDLLSKKTGVTILASNVHSNNVSQEYNEAFWDWMSDPKRSPWKALLTKGIETIKDSEGFLRGFILPGEVVDENPWFLSVNFCVAARMTRENPYSIAAWHEFVKGGMCPCEAFYLCRYVNFTNNRYSFSRKNNDGSHWPLKDFGCGPIGDYTHRYRGFTFENFRKGVFNSEASDITSVWNHPKLMGRAYHRFSPNEMDNSFYSEIANTKFSSYRILDIDKVIEAFKKWKENQGV